jgi:hypothetical protein
MTSKYTKHTKGPWTWHRGRNGYYLNLIAAGGEVVITAHELSVHPWEIVEVIDADAHLVSAAPDLLEALEQAVREISAMNDMLETPIYDSDIKRWKAAIAKARGEIVDD